MEPVIDHIQITVRDLDVAEAFYDRLLPILGFDLSHKSRGRVAAHELDVVEYLHPTLTFAVSSPRQAFVDDTVHRRKPGALHHLAFRASSRAEIDRLYPQIRAAGAQIVDEPRFYPQHGESYYALFFKDLDGIKYELVYEERSPV